MGALPWCCGWDILPACLRQAALAPPVELGWGGLVVGWWVPPPDLAPLNDPCGPPSPLPQFVHPVAAPGLAEALDVRPLGFLYAYITPRLPSVEVG